MPRDLKIPKSYRAYPDTVKRLQFICSHLGENESEMLSLLIRQKYDAIKLKKAKAKAKAK